MKPIKEILDEVKENAKDTFAEQDEIKTWCDAVDEVETQLQIAGWIK